MDVIVGFFLAAVLLVLCVGFGLAVSTAVTRILTGEDPDNKGPRDGSLSVRPREALSCK